MTYARQFNFPTIKSDKTTIVNIICAILLVVLIVILIICLATKKDKFSEQHGTKKENGYVLLHNHNCPYSKKMYQQLKDNEMKIGDFVVEVIDIADKKNETLLSLYNFGGATPQLTVKNKPNVTSIGFKSLSDVEKELNPDPNQGSDIEVTVVGKRACPFCKKAEELLKKINVKYTFLDSNSPEGSEYMKLHKALGVPLILNKDKPPILGFDQKKIIEQLS
tara:strand:- start:32 stop:694 length:663 start_codon:yes stop_codon:yes gene_type:complete